MEGPFWLHHNPNFRHPRQYINKWYLIGLAVTCLLTFYTSTKPYVPFLSKWIPIVFLTILWMPVVLWLLFETLMFLINEGYLSDDHVDDARAIMFVFSLIMEVLYSGPVFVFGVCAFTCGFYLHHGVDHEIGLLTQLWNALPEGMRSGFMNATSKAAISYAKDGVEYIKSWM